MRRCQDTTQGVVDEDTYHPLLSSCSLCARRAGVRPGRPPRRRPAAGAGRRAAGAPNTWTIDPAHIRHRLRRSPHDGEQRARHVRQGCRHASRTTARTSRRSRPTSRSTRRASPPTTRSATRTSRAPTSSTSRRSRRSRSSRSACRRSTAGKFKLIGDLTMHGVTKEVTLDVEGPSQPIVAQGATRVGATATTTLNRQDYGVKWSRQHRRRRRGGRRRGQESTPRARARSKRESQALSRGSGASVESVTAYSATISLPVSWSRRSALVPAAQTRPPAFVYIARSTTICAGVAPRLSTSAPKRALDRRAGTRRRTSTLKRLLPAQREGPRRRALPSSNSSVTRTWPATRRVRDQDVGLRAARAARPRPRPAPTPCPSPSRPASCAPRTTAAGSARPPHRSLDDRPARCWSTQRSSTRRVGQQPLAVERSSSTQMVSGSAPRPCSPSSASTPSGSR